MNYELLMKGIDGEVWSLDLPLDAPAMNYQINNLAELKDRNASYSQRISLPRTTHNEQAFQFSFEVGSDSCVPYMKFPCQLFYEGALISPAGAVLNIVDVSDTSIGVQILGATVDLFDTLNNTDAKDPGMVCSSSSGTRTQWDRLSDTSPAPKRLKSCTFGCMQLYKRTRTSPFRHGGNQASQGVGQVLPPPQLV